MFGEPGSEVIKHFSYSTQLSMKFFLLINIKMPTDWGNKNLSKWFHYVGQDGHHAHAWYKPFKNLLHQNRETGNL